MEVLPGISGESLFPLYAGDYHRYTILCWAGVALPFLGNDFHRSSLIMFQHSRCCRRLLTAGQDAAMLQPACPGKQLAPSLASRSHEEVGGQSGRLLV